jgi:phytoene synthase
MLLKAFPRWFLVITVVTAWQSQVPYTRRATLLQSLAAPNNDINEEIQSGRLLEGGAVIDFSSVKASSKAEAALAKAREALTGRPPLAHSTILGINDDVVREVGHPLGQFASQEDIQACAAYLRSIAPKDLFVKRNDASTEPAFSSEQIAEFQTLLSKAFEEAGEVTSAFAKTFYLGTKVMGSEAQRAIWAVYVWCRRTDEIVDAPRDNNEDMLHDLSLWELRLEKLWKYGEVVDVYDLCLLDSLVRYPNLDITPFLDMIRGMLMDVPGLGQDRYEKFDELHLYCYRVAGTVGLMSLPIFGCAPDYNDEVARYVYERSDAQACRCT